MKKHLRLLFLLAAVCLLSGCGKPSGCEISVSVGFPEYSSGYFCRADGEGGRLDSLLVEDGRLHIVRTDLDRMPYVAFIHLENPQDSIDRLEMPVVVEPGNVQVEIGEYITSAGTPLNGVLQQFLNELQATSTSLKGKDMDAGEVRSAFSSFYRQQILLNRDNVVGDFIYRSYGVHLMGDDLQSVKTALGK